MVANVTAAPVRDPDEIVSFWSPRCAEPCAGANAWATCTRHGVDLFVEIGAGKVLAGLVKRTAEGARSLNVGVPADVKSFSPEGIGIIRSLFMFESEQSRRAGDRRQSGGLGAEIARALHRQGAKARSSGTRREALDALAAELGEGAFVRSPATSPILVSGGKAASEAEALAGPLDILVNNAGVTRDGLFLRMKDEDWDDGA